jgi:cytochrome c553
VKGERIYSWRNAWFRWSVGCVVAIAAFAIVAGFAWLPSVQKDYMAEGLWASICRAAGVPAAWSPQASSRPAAAISSRVVADPVLLQRAGAEEVGRGATLALQCTICHGARGLSQADAPNLAGQYPEVIYKQLLDYQNGQRRNPVMQALAGVLSERDIRDLAAYYAFLPRPTVSLVLSDSERVPALVRVGAPMRSIAPCASCHGGIDQKPGSPWLEGMPKAYLQTQLQAFARSERHNDVNAQMRNVARQMTPEEIIEVASYYASRPEGQAGAARSPAEFTR